MVEFSKGEEGGIPGAGSIRKKEEEGKREKFLAAMRPGGTPVPIPNTEVKAWAAENTMPGTAWENRRLPD